MSFVSRADPDLTSPPTSGDVSTRKSLSRKHREWLAAALFLAPDVLGLLVFLILPIVLALGMGFFEVSGFGDYEYIGLDNYRFMIDDGKFRESLKVTLTYCVLLVPSLFVLGLSLALLMQQRLPFSGVLRSLFFIPHVVSLVVIGVVWQFLLVDRIGVVNKALRRIGLQSESWLGDPQHALGTVLVVSLWFLVGYYMIIFLGGLQDIPQEYYDAARIDGASFLQMFRGITLPLLKPTSFFILVVSLVAAVAGQQGFDLIFVMTMGGPANSTSLLSYYIYQQAFQVGNYGYAAAMASFLVVVLLCLTGVIFALTKGGRFDFD